MAVNKVVVNNITKLDLTSDTVNVDTLLSGIKAHNAKGKQITGTFDTSIFVKVTENQGLSETEKANARDNIGASSNNSRSHAIPRQIDWTNNTIGKNITNYYNGTETYNGKTFSQAVVDGSFDNIYVGDYVVQTVTINGSSVQNIKYVADLNTWKSDASDCARISQNHVTFLNVLNITHRMNATNTTKGGYAGSEMASWLDSTVLPALQTATGSTSRFLTHRKMLSNAVGTSLYNRYGSATGASSDWNWYIKKISLMTESQIYGHTVWSSSGFDTGEAFKKLAIFDAVNPSFIFASKKPWLRDVSSASNFCILSEQNHATNVAANVAFFVAPLTIEL